MGRTCQTQRAEARTETFAASCLKGRRDRGCPDHRSFPLHHTAPRADAAARHTDDGENCRLPLTGGCGAHPGLSKPTVETPGSPQLTSGPRSKPCLFLGCSLNGASVWDRKHGENYSRCLHQGWDRSGAPTSNVTSEVDKDPELKEVQVRGLSSQVLPCWWGGGAAGCEGAASSEPPLRSAVRDRGRGPGQAPRPSFPPRHLLPLSGFRPSSLELPSTPVVADRLCWRGSTRGQLRPLPTTLRNPVPETSSRSQHGGRGLGPTLRGVPPLSSGPTLLGGMLPLPCLQAPS